MNQLLTEIESELLSSEECLGLKAEWGGIRGALSEMSIRRQRTIGQWLKTVKDKKGRKRGKISGEEFLRIAPPEVLLARVELLVLGV
jgi:hypothetical protein